MISIFGGATPMEHMPSNYFFDDRCPSDKYAHLKNCTTMHSEANSVMGLKTVIDTNRHVYLRDHVFGGNSLVPATMIMELLAESATWFSESRGLKEHLKLLPVRIEDLFIDRALALQPGVPLEIRILLRSAESVSTGYRMKIDIVSKRVAKSGKSIGDRLNASGNVVLSSRATALPEVELPADNCDHFRISPDKYYPFYFPALGPLFQSGTGNFSVDKGKSFLIGEYNCSDKERDFIRDQTSEFLISPLGCDSCLQYTVFLSRIRTIKGRLPVGCKRFTFFRKHPENEPCNVFTKCLHLDDDIMISDLWALDRNGRIIVAAEGFVVRKDPFHEYTNREEFERLLYQNKMAEPGR